MLHKLTASVLAVDLLRTKLADDSHSVGGLNYVHLAGPVLLPVSLTCLQLTSQVQLPRSKNSVHIGSSSYVAKISMKCARFNF
jgi:hypothetical protein